jgi:hypothetical protein
MVRVQICEVGAIPSPFSLAQQWVGLFNIVDFPFTSHDISLAKYEWKSKHVL